MGNHDAQAYADLGTPEEQSRREFLANATIAIGGAMSLTLAVPLATSLVPESLAAPSKAAHPVWSMLPGHELAALAAQREDPVEIKFRFPYADGYLPAIDHVSVWGLKLSPEQERTFKAKRPELFGNSAKATSYAPMTLSFVMFSSVCPHLGCSYKWDAATKRFFCPCHGSQFGRDGEKLAGPAPRGLDPLPFREQSGRAQVTWIKYKANTPDRIVVGYT